MTLYNNESKYVVSSSIYVTLHQVKRLKPRNGYARNIIIIFHSCTKFFLLY